jgi:Fe2+ transport system protein FeoA
LGSNCPIICCPECGHTTIDATKSKLGRIALTLLTPEAKPEHTSLVVTLAEAPKGADVRVVSLVSDGSSRPIRLQAYGLAPGRWIRVLQQEPVTVVQAEHTELALEDDLAAKVLVEVGE